MCVSKEGQPSFTDFCCSKCETNGEAVEQEKLCNGVENVCSQMEQKVALKKKETL